MNYFKVTLEFDTTNSDGVITGGTCDLYFRSEKNGSDVWEAVSKYLHNQYFPLYPYCQFGIWSITQVDSIPSNEFSVEV